MKNIIKRVFNALGYTITKNPKIDGSYHPYTRISMRSRKIIDLEALANISLSIPGMITTRSGQFLYALCSMQELAGDVVEIGSWQGRSTSFLARAVHETGNGKYYAVDHFKGNVGKEDLYMVNKSDLSDLKDNFLANVGKLGMSNTVTLLDMPVEQAALSMSNVKIRFLFIDGDHSKAGVTRDIGLFFPKLIKGSIIVFDDFFEGSGVAEAVDDLMEKHLFSSVFTYQNTLVVKL